MQTDSLLRELRTVLPDSISDDSAQHLLAIARTIGETTDRNREFSTLIQTPQLVELLGISRQAIHKAVHAGRIIAVREGRTWLYPLWQISPIGTIFDGVPAVHARLYERVDAQRALRWWTRSRAELSGQSPAQWVRSGASLVPVVSAAERFANQH